VKKQLLLTAIVGGLSAASASAVEVTGNAGVVSEYVFRGITSSDGKAAAQGGLDVGFGPGFYLGTWASKVDFGSSDGVEIDLYGGYSGEYEDFTYGIGATLYTYTDDADEDYLEINLSGGWKWFTIDYAKGEYDQLGGPDVDYDHFSITAEYEGLYAKYGSNGDDLWQGVDADYFEVGYGGTATVNGEDLFDYSIAYIDSDDGLLIGTTANSRLVFGIVKNFEIASN
jgi:uncharacterized protein (TIGR02001 family)